MENESGFKVAVDRVLIKPTDTTFSLIARPILNKILFLFAIFGESLSLYHAINYVS